MSLYLRAAFASTSIWATLVAVLIRTFYFLLVLSPFSILPGSRLATGRRWRQMTSSCAHCTNYRSEVTAIFVIKPACTHLFRNTSCMHENADEVRSKKKNALCMLFNLFVIHTNRWECARIAFKMKRHINIQQQSFTCEAILLHITSTHQSIHRCSIFSFSLHSLVHSNIHSNAPLRFQTRSPVIHPTYPPSTFLALQIF